MNKRTLVRQLRPSHCHAGMLCLIDKTNTYPDLAMRTALMRSGWSASEATLVQQKVCDLFGTHFWNTSVYAMRSGGNMGAHYLSNPKEFHDCALLVLAFLAEMVRHGDFKV